MTHKAIDRMIDQAPSQRIMAATTPVRIALVLLLALGFVNCLSFRDLAGFPCPSTGTCPAHLICRGGICVDPASPTETAPEAVPDKESPTPDATSPDQVSPEPPDERKVTEPPREPTQEPPAPEKEPDQPPDRAPPEPPGSDDAAPPKPLSFQIEKVFDVSARKMWGLAGAPEIKGLIIAGEKTTPGGTAGMLLKGPAYTKTWHWEQAYSTQKSLFDVLMVTRDIYLAVGLSHQLGKAQEYGPILRAPLHASAAGWRNVKLTIPETQGEHATLYRLAKTASSGSQEPILAVGTTNAKSGGVGLVLESRDQGVSWRKLTLPRNNATTFRDVAFFPGKKGAVVVGNGSAISFGTISANRLLWQGTGPKIKGDYRAVAVVPPVDLVLSATTDKGAHFLQYYDGTKFRWFTANHPTNLPQINGLAFHDGMGLAVGAGGAIFRSLDRGRSWQALPSPTTQDLHRVFFYEKRVYISGAQVILSASLAP